MTTQSVPLVAKPNEEKGSSVLLAGSGAGLHNVGEQRWFEFPEPMVIESGAAETLLPRRWFADHETSESAGSRAGAHYVGANGDLFTMRVKRYWSSQTKTETMYA